MRLVPSRFRPSKQRQLVIRRQVADYSRRLATRTHDYLEFVGIAHLPVSRYEPRWGHGRPSHVRLDRIIGSGGATYRQTLATLIGYADDLAKIPLHETDALEPHWHNSWIPGLDGAALYGLVRSVSPPRYVEVGSGISTLFVHRARRDGKTGTMITSIDPSPRSGVDAVCDRVIRAPLEATDLSVFGELQAGDMVFIDNSHHALLNSDVATFFFDVLPELPAGVVVGVHDILLPDDYFPEWGGYYFSEQYVLGGLLMAGGDWWEPILAAWWSSQRADLQSVMDPLWTRPHLAGVPTHGVAFWFRTTGRLG